MRNRMCPNKIACFDYDADNCEECAVGEKIARLTRKVKRLQAQLEAQTPFDKLVSLFMKKQFAFEISVGESSTRYFHTILENQEYFISEDNERGIDELIANVKAH